MQKDKYVIVEGSEYKVSIYKITEPNERDLDIAWNEYVGKSTSITITAAERVHLHSAFVGGWDARRKADIQSRTPTDE